MESNIFGSFAFSSPTATSLSVSEAKARSQIPAATQDPQSCASVEVKKEQGIIKERGVLAPCKLPKTEPVDCSDDIEKGLLHTEAIRSPIRKGKKRKVLSVKKCSDSLRGAETAKRAIKIETEAETEIEDTGLMLTRQSVKVESVASKGKGAERSPSKGGGKVDVIKEPTHWQAIVDRIRSMRSRQDAPVDLLGTPQLLDESADKETQRFQALVAAMISSQTRDAITAAAMHRLRAMPGGLSVTHVASDDVAVDTLVDLLYPVGFYRQKAKYLKAIAKILSSPPNNGSVPCTLNDLMKLPGVGPKVALLVLWVAFGRGEEGLIVDTNVRRVCCRLGWVPEDATPEKTRRALESWLPQNLWPDVSFLFVGFGQQICKPIRPKCEFCIVNHLCPTGLKHIPKKSASQKKILKGLKSFGDT